MPTLIFNKPSQTGQAQLVITLVVSVISLVLGAAITQRAVSNLKQTTYTAQAVRAQKAADAGAEEALGVADLSTWLGTHSVNLGDGSTATYTVAEYGGGSSITIDQLGKDETRQVDLTSTGLTGLEVRWSQSGENKDAIIVYSIIHKDGAGNVTIQQKGATDPTESGADGCNLPLNSSDPTANPGDLGYDHKTTISGLSVNPGAGEKLYLRIRPLCQDQVDMMVTALPAGANLPTQGYTITSTGTYGEAQWTVEVTKTNPALPAIFDYAIFSESDLTK